MDGIRRTLGRLFHIRKSVLYELTTMIDTMQQMASDINKMRRSLLIHLSTDGAYTSRRGPVAEGLQGLALPSRSVEKLQYRVPNPSRWNRYMVLPRKYLHCVEREGFSFVDLWKTYVLNSKLGTILIPSSSCSWFGKEYFAVSRHHIQDHIRL